MLNIQVHRVAAQDAAFPQATALLAVARYFRPLHPKRCSHRATTNVQRMRRFPRAVHCQRIVLHTVHGRDDSAGHTFASSALMDRAWLAMTEHRDTTAKRTDSCMLRHRPLPTLQSSTLMSRASW